MTSLAWIIRTRNEEIIGYLSKGVNNHFERSRVKNNEIYITGPKITSRDQELRKFERLRVNLLSYIGKKIGTRISLREIEVRVIESQL
jgi:hypothetical protein